MRQIAAFRRVRRPEVESYEGKTLGDSQARHALKLPEGSDLKAVRDRALPIGSRLVGFSDLLRRPGLGARCCVKDIPA